MIRLAEIAHVVVGVHLQADPAGPCRLLRLSGMAEVRAGKPPTLLPVRRPEVGRAVPVEPGDLVATARGTKIEAFVADSAVSGAFVSLDLYLVRPDRDRVLPEYLLAVLESPVAQAAFDESRQGSNPPRLPKAALEGVSVPLPSMEQQRMIVGLRRTLGCEARLLRELQARQAIASAEIMRRAVWAGVPARGPIGSQA